MRCESAWPWGLNKRLLCPVVHEDAFMVICMKLGFSLSDAWSLLG